MKTEIESEEEVVIVVLDVCDLCGSTYDVCNGLCGECTTLEEGY
jgi:hypothetical protein